MELPLECYITHGTIELVIIGSCFPVNFYGFLTPHIFVTGWYLGFLTDFM